MSDNEGGLDQVVSLDLRCAGRAREGRCVLWW